MKIPFCEILYASTQFNLLTGTGGFGVRTYTQGMPLELIDRLKSRNLFYYTSGKKQLSGVHELLQNPGLPADFPKTYACFREIIGDKNWLVLTRTVFLGRDYGWYLDSPEQNARTGNTFTHAVCFEESENTRVAQAHLFRYFAQHFLPENLRNDSSNPELRRLLTNSEGRPQALPVSTVEVPDSLSTNVFSATPELIETVLAVYYGFEIGKKIVVALPASETEGFIGHLLECFPSFLRCQLDFVANYQDFNLESRYKLLFVNEYYDRALDERNPNLLLCNCTTRQFPLLPRSDFYEYLRHLLTSNDFARLQSMLVGMDNILESFEPGLSLEQVFYAWHFLWSGEPPRYTFQPETVMRQIDAYPLKKAYRERVNKHILDNFLQAIEQGNHAKIATSLKLVDDLNWGDNLKWGGQGFDSIGTSLTNYILDKNNATELIKLGADERAICRNLTSLKDRADELTGFISRNELMPREALDHFIVQFCIAAPERTEEFIYMALLSPNKPDHRLGEELLTKMSKPFEFLATNDFFVFLGEDGQRLIFDQSIKACLVEMYQTNQNPAFHMRRVLARIPQALPYQHFLTEKFMSDNSTKFRDLIYLLETYAILVEEKKYDRDTLSMMNNLLHVLLRSAGQASAEDWDFLKNKIEVIEGCLASLKDELPFAHQRARFVYTTLQNEDDPDRLKHKIAFIFDNEHFFYTLDSYLQFLLAATSTTIWQEEEKAKKFARFLFDKEKEEESWRDLRMETDQDVGKVGLSDYVPWYVSKVIKSRIPNETFAMQELEDYFCNYTFAFWALSRKKRDPGEAPAKEYFWYSNLLKLITNYLFELKKRDRPLLQRVVTRICTTEGDERIVDLKQHLEATFASEIISKGTFSSIKNLFSSQKKD